MARPFKYSPAICEMVSVYGTTGKTKKSCCELLGITQQTWCNWANRFVQFDRAQRSWAGPCGDHYYGQKRWRETMADKWGELLF